MSGNLLSYAGWTFLPNLATGWLQSFYYSVTIRAGDPKPPPGSPRFMKDRRRIHILVVTLYLLYTIFEADWQIRRASDFYQDLGVPLDVDERGIKSRFRRLAAFHHPDKVADSSARDASEVYFVHLRQAQETLLDPAKRFAYDRFGPDMLSWKHCSSIRDYVLVGVQHLTPYYAAGGLFMIILGVLGFLEWGRYWRYWTFSLLLLIELHTITSPQVLILLSHFLNPLLTTFTAGAHAPLLPFQFLVLARKTTLTIFIALSQLGPLLTMSTSPGGAAAANPNSQQHLLVQLGRLANLSAGIDTETTRLLGMDMAPFAGDEGAVKEVRERIRDWLVQNTVRSDPEVRDAVGRIMGRRRAGPPGVRGGGSRGRGR